jgi:hypothetical protein
MKSVKVAIGVVLLGGLLAGTAPAQVNMAYPQNPYPYQTMPVQPAAYANNGYLFAAPGEASASPSDMAVASDCNSCRSCGQVCDPCSPCSGCCLGEPWTLFGENCRGIKMGGWISAGGYANAHGNASNGPIGMTNVGDGFTLNQLWGFIDKPVNTGGCGWDFGGRVDYVFGVDGPDTQAFGDTGWDNDWDTARDYGSAIPQLYAEIGYNDWTVKIGHFYTPMGYEVVQATGNFFYSHAYTHHWGEPFTHSGALATYGGFDNWTFYGGWTAGWDTGFEDGGDASTFLGGASYSMCDDVTVSYMLNAGDWGTVNGGDIYMHSIVMELALLENLTWIIQNDLGVQSDVPGRDRHWGGVNQYMIYEINDCWSLGGRIEWFNDRDGSRGIGPAGSYYNLTGGVNWRPHANLVFRPEVRYDWFDGQAAAGNLPYNGGQDEDQFSGGFDVVFTF